MRPLLMVWLAGGCWLGTIGCATGRQPTLSGPTAATSEESARDVYCGPMEVAWPTLSPDGTRVVFSGRDARQRWRLWMAPIQGAGVDMTPITPATLQAHATRPRFARSGNRIAYRRSEGGNHAPGTIWVLDLDRGRSSSFQEIPAGSTNDHYPDWFPDGERLLVTRYREASQSFDLAIVDARSASTLTTDGAYDGKATLSPNAGELAFASDRDGRIDIWVMDIGLGEVSARRVLGGGSRAPAWSPINQWIAFQSERGGTSDVYAVRSDSGDVVRITDGENAHHPAWSFDGRRIAYDVDLGPNEHCIRLRSVGERFADLD